MAGEGLLGQAEKVGEAPGAARGEVRWGRWTRIDKRASGGKKVHRQGRLHSKTTVN